ncbi:hypothetical protein [Bradyrhizobium oligotrophicum]|uniref:hypothetical protein n=1 Tax=Bradyrhizobium oligotrophicum TaxID=44255 RepID=UPI003EB717A4
MSQPSLNETLKALADLSVSNSDLTPAPVDDIIDPYLVGFGKDTSARRSELAEAFRKGVPSTERSDFICQRILGRIP